MNRNSQSFTERMAQGKELAQIARNRGQSVGAHKSWRRRRDGRPIAEQRAEWKAYRAECVGRELAELDNYFRNWKADQIGMAHAAVAIALFGESAE